MRRTDQILAQLFEKQALTLEEYEYFDSYSAPYEKNHHLINILCTKPDYAYRQFLEALDSTGQRHLRSDLEQEESTLGGIIAHVN